MESDNRQAALDQLLAIAMTNGYVTFDDISQCADDHSLSIGEFDWLSAMAGMRNVIIYDEAPKPTSLDDEEFEDFAQTDYELLFAEAIQTCPELEPLVNDIRHITPPQRGEVGRLKHQIQEGNIYARKRMTEMYLRLALRIAVSRAKAYDLDLEEAVGDAFVGLLMAVDKYDPDNSGPFASFASFWIFQNITREQSTKNPNIYFPVHRKEWFYIMYPLMREKGCIECDQVFQCEMAVNMICEKIQCQRKYVQDVLMASIPSLSLYELSESDFENLRPIGIASAAEKYPWKLRDILPKVLPAGADAGTLTENGARFLDPGGGFQAGIPLVPCEGDAGTGMTATNSVRVRTGNGSAGTSDFAMIVTEHALGVHQEIDMVTTPAGSPAAMVHCNNCTSDINAWVNLFAEFAQAAGMPADKGNIFTFLFRKALEGDPDCGGLLNYNYYSGEGITRIDEGRPVFARIPGAKFTLANFMRAQLLSALATLKIGLDILTAEEQVPIDRLYGHGGFFKTPEAGQRMLSAAVGAPVSVMETAGEGGPFGMALLAAYLLWRKPGESLEDYLQNKVFADVKSVTLTATPEEITGFQTFLQRYQAAFPLEQTAVSVL